MLLYTVKNRGQELISYLFIEVREIPWVWPFYTPPPRLTDQLTNQIESYVFLYDVVINMHVWRTMGHQSHPVDQSEMCVCVAEVVRTSGGCTWQRSLVAGLLTWRV